jgi:hypothetical protein
MIKRRLVLVIFAILFLALSASAQVAQIYISNEWQKNIEQLNFTTGALTALYNIGSQPDDMIVNSAGQVIYSIPNLGTVELFDPTTGTNTTLASGIPGARDLEIEPGGLTMLIAKVSSPPEIIRYTFSSGTWVVFIPKATFGSGGSCNGITYDGYGNLYAVANRNTIIQINPTTGAVIATLVTEAHNGANGSDGLTYDAYTNSLWATHAGKVLGGGLIQIPVQQSGFVSTSPSGFTFYSTPKVGAPDGIKSDGIGNLYIGAIHTAAVYNIPTKTLTYNITTNGADGVGIVPGTIPAPPASPRHHGRNLNSDPETNN